MHTGDQAEHNLVIKLPATYCADAHRKLAEMGQAPCLWFCELLESVDMYAVVMGYEDGARAYELPMNGTHCTTVDCWEDSE